MDKQVQGRKENKEGGNVKEHKSEKAKNSQVNELERYYHSYQLDDQPIMRYPFFHLLRIRNNEVLHVLELMQVLSCYIYRKLI